MGLPFPPHALRREGFAVDHNRLHRLHCREGLKLWREKRKRVSRSQTSLDVPAAPNERWSMDFISYQLADGRRLWTFNAIDDFSREALAIDVGTSIPGAAIVSTLERLAQKRGYAQALVMDNGPELTGRALDTWAYQNGVKLAFIQSGKPTQNTFAESFNGAFRPSSPTDT